MKKRVLIISAKYTPGHISHLLAFYKLFHALNFDVTMLLDAKYAGVYDDDIQIIYLEDGMQYPSANIALVYNMSIHDSAIVRSIKRQGQCHAMFVYHEPWYGLKKWISDVFHKRVKPIVLVKNIGIHYFAKKLLKNIDMVLLPSSKAVSVYQSHDVRYNKNYVEFPLLFTDENRNKMFSRDFFSFIATADKEKNFPLFIQFISKYLPMDGDLKVQIVTRTNISSFWNSDLDKYIENGRLVVQSGRNLSNEEINTALAKSCCTWLYYYHSTQSGVLARAFMCGSPVLGSTSGCLQDYINGSNGLICKSETLEDLYAAYVQIRNNKDDMSAAARASYQQFDYTYAIETMRSLIDNF